MIVERVLYNIKDIDLEKLEVDFVDIEWYEVQKKILRKLSSNGIEVGIRNSNGEALKEGDVLWQEGNKVFGCKDSLLRLYRAEASKYV